MYCILTKLDHEGNHRNLWRVQSQTHVNWNAASFILIPPDKTLLPVTCRVLATFLKWPVQHSELFVLFSRSYCRERRWFKTACLGPQWPHRQQGGTWLGDSVMVTPGSGATRWENVSMLIFFKPTRINMPSSMEKGKGKHTYIVWH